MKLIIILSVLVKLSTALFQLPSALFKLPLHSFSTSIKEVDQPSSPTIIKQLGQTCEFIYNLELGQRLVIHNTEYPQPYRGRRACTWRIQSEWNTKMVISCSDVDIPASNACYEDRLTVSLTGNPTFVDGRNFCGSGQLTLVSSQNSLAVGLFTAWYSGGGRFLCTVTPIVRENPAPPNPNPVCDCGRRQERRIVGGQETGLHEYPSMAAIMEGNFLLCGSSIISQRYALTAAHCLRNQTSQRLQLLVGDHNIESNADGTGTRYALSRLIVHPSYNGTTQVNDIAIIQTTAVMTFNAYVSPVCLPFRYSNMDFVGLNLITLGWGTDEFTGALSPTLQEVNLTVINNAVCAQQLSAQRIQISNSELCTFTRGRDACQYDSGGPLMWYKEDIRRLELVGIISFGIGCASNFPSVNTRVTSFLDWIVTSTPDAQYCII